MKTNPTLCGVIAATLLFAMYVPRVYAQQDGAKPVKETGKKKNPKSDNPKDQTA